MIDSRTYSVSEEQLLWLCDYLKNTVIPTLNNNAEAVTELQNLYIQLKQYVEDYFSDLNVQNEINNKLDEMSEDGTLDRIINQQIFSDLNDEIADLNNEIIETNSNINKIISEPKFRSFKFN